MSFMLFAASLSQPADSFHVDADDLDHLFSALAPRGRRRPAPASLVTLQDCPRANDRAILSLSISHACLSSSCLAAAIPRIAVLYFGDEAQLDHVAFGFLTGFMSLDVGQ